MEDRQSEARTHIAQGFEALGKGRSADAEAAARRALAVDASRPESHFLVGLIALERQDWRTAANAFGSVTKLNPADRAAWAHLARLLFRAGQFERAEAALTAAIVEGEADAETADLIGAVLTLFGRFEEAKYWHQQAYSAKPDRADFAINVAAAHMFAGFTQKAEDVLAPLLARQRPVQAEWMYSSLKRADGRQRADDLISRATLAQTPESAAFLAYAAGKEFEDCEIWPDAFSAFAYGAKAKRSTLFFDEAGEAETFEAMHSAFTADWFTSAADGCDDLAPIFIVGQPRTGTTLVERIIASHSAVESAGELQQFGLCVRRLTSLSIAAAQSRVAASAQISPRLLGEAYLSSTQSMRRGKRRFIDKLPRNFLHIPLIKKSLPRSKIVHLVRSPMDTCFANYKQLFADAYFHSYDQEEMGRHYCRYHRLMAHWRTMMPGTVLDVHYERLVSDFETEARNLIAFLDLPWEDACLNFHLLEQPVATASAVQVREPAHSRSVGRWRRYAAQLAPMRRILTAEGLAPPVVTRSDH